MTVELVPRAAIRWVLIAAASVTMHAAFAQSMAYPPATESPAIPPEVAGETHGAELERRVGAFVRAITHNSALSDGDSLARWNAPVCLLLAGLTPKETGMLSNRLSQTIASAGAPLARAPCQPNFIIIATSEPDLVLKAWYARDRLLFGDATAPQVSQFLAGSHGRPVRIWYNIDTGRKSGTRNGHFIPSDVRAESSAFTRSAVIGFSSIFAIIDTQRTEHTALDPLADFVAMAGLAGVDLNADIGGTPSILGLFSRGADQQPSGLSRWDLAFLRALYQSDQSSRSQRFEITEMVTHDISR